ncbi:MAG: hypothetical protein ACXW3D_06690 [Caulobacteraceae bacterium]
MIRRAINIAAAAGFTAAAAAALAVAVSYALFALCHDQLGLTAAASAAIVAAAIAVVMGIGAMIFFNKGGGGHSHKPEPTMAEKAMEFVRQRPVVSAAGLIAVSIIALRNPALIATLVAGAMAEKAGGKQRKR